MFKLIHIIILFFVTVFLCSLIRRSTAKYMQAMMRLQVKIKPDSVKFYIFMDYNVSECFGSAQT